METECRCGWNGMGEHPCHNNGYTCRKPAKIRFISTGPVALPGMQLKVGAYDTYACDECWREFSRRHDAR